MPQYILYIDGSQENVTIQNELERCGIDMLVVQEPPDGTIFPKLSGPQGVFQGIANISTYFLRRHQPLAEA